jgi:hypothetical protein
MITPIKQHKRGVRRARQNKSSGKTGPMQMKANIEVRHKYRFTSSSSSQTTIFGSTLVNALGVSATTAILGQPIFQTFKVNRIEIWAPPSAQGSFATCSVQFPGTNQSPSREFSDTSVSVTDPAHVIATPPPLSLCSFWTNANEAGGANDPLFTLVAPTGSIIELHMSMIVNDAAPPQSTAVLVGATIGAVYYCSLDSSTSAGSIYKPVSLSNL